MAHHSNLYIDIHALQTVPPSCVNRDDTGSPKTAIYGGVTRARVSSQAWKRAVRLMFQDCFDLQQLGQRTKRGAELVAARMEACGYQGDSLKGAVKALDYAGVKTNKEGLTDTLLFLSYGQAEALARLAVAGETDKTLYKDALKNHPSVDMALFGRMVASDPSLNYDAASQVAHSISTHETRNEYDYFTAVDDRSPSDNQGAGHLGTVEFHSATLYRYATVNVRELAQHLKYDATPAVHSFIKAFLLSMPTGKQNTFANRTVPDLAYITVRRDQPVNLVGAFERPVSADAGGYMVPSAQALAAYAQKTYQAFVSAPELAFCVGQLDGTEDLAPSLCMQDVLERVDQVVQGYCEQGDTL